MLLFWVLMFFLPISILIGIVWCFQKVFHKTYFFEGRELNDQYIKWQFVIAIIFITTYFIKIYTGVMIINQLTFNCLFIVGYISTALFYPGINHQYIRPWMKYTTLLLSMALWLPLVILVNPYGLYILSAESRALLGIDTELIFENHEYRVEQLGIVPRSGAQHYYLIIQKETYYEKKLDEIMLFPTEIDQYIEAHIEEDQ